MATTSEEDSVYKIILSAIVCAALVSPVFAQSDAGVQKGQHITLRNPGFGALDSVPSMGVKFFNRDGTIDHEIPFGQVCQIYSRSKHKITVIAVEGDDVLVSYDGPSEKPRATRQECSPENLFFLPMEMVAKLLQMDREEQANEEARKHPERRLEKWKSEVQKEQDRVNRLLNQ